MHKQACSAGCNEVYKMRMQLLASVLYYYPLVRVVDFRQQLAVCVDSISEGKTTE